MIPVLRFLADFAGVDEADSEETAVSTRSSGKLRLGVKRSSRCVAENVEVVNEQLRLVNSMAKKLYVHAVSCAQSLAFGIQRQKC